MTSRRRFNRYIAAALSVVALIMLVLGFTVVQVTDYAEKSCYTRLRETAQQRAATLRELLDADREELMVLSRSLSRLGLEPRSALLGMIPLIREGRTFDAVAVLLPDGTFLSHLGGIEQDARPFDFAEESARTPYLSGVARMPGAPDTKVYYQTVPVVRDGRVIALVFGFTELRTTFADRVSITAYGGEAELHVIDRSGEMLLNTWRSTLGNIWEADRTTRLEPGFDIEKIRRDFAEEREGVKSYRSRKQEILFFTHYLPVGEGGWMMQLNVPRDVAFASADHMQKLSFLLCGLEVLLLGAYLVWILKQVRRERAEERLRLEQTVYMFEVQQTLFDAHTKPIPLQGCAQKGGRKHVRGGNRLLPDRKGPRHGRLLFVRRTASDRRSRQGDRRPAQTELPGTRFRTQRASAELRRTEPRHGHRLRTAPQDGHRRHDVHARHEPQPRTHRSARRREHPALLAGLLGP